MLLPYLSEEDVRVIVDELCKYFITFSLIAGYFYCIVFIQNA